jgi:hypothetical protein
MPQRRRQPKSPAARDEAKKLLIDVLSNGPLLKAETEEAAKANGVAERTLVAS